MKKDIIITAGGFGRRLWPVSTFEKPKQFMSLEGEISFLQSTILRALKLNLDGYIVVVTRHDLHAICQDQILDLAELMSIEEKHNFFNRLIIILEPFSNGTASSVLLGLLCLKNLHKKDSYVLLMPSDHIIGPFEYYEQDIKKGFLLNPLQKIACFGIEPMYPAINYGYIEMGKTLEVNRVLYEDVYMVTAFQEKPQLEKAKLYLEKGNFLWNTAIYTFPLHLMLEEYKKYQTEMYKSFKGLPKNFCNLEVINDLQVLNPSEIIEEVYRYSPRLSFDYGITTHTKKACVVNASFSWEDVGNWDSFSSLFTPPTEKIIEIKGNNNFIYSDIPVALCGVENISVIIKNGEALIIQKGSGELVKDAYIKMKEKRNENESEFLD